MDMSLKAAIRLLMKATPIDFSVKVKRWSTDHSKLLVCSIGSKYKGAFLYDVPNRMLVGATANWYEFFVKASEKAKERPLRIKELAPF
jgi:hypothetical protein